MFLLICILGPPDLSPLICTLQNVGWSSEFALEDAKMFLCSPFIVRLLIYFDYLLSKDHWLSRVSEFLVWIQSVQMNLIPYPGGVVCWGIVCCPWPRGQIILCSALALFICQRNLPLSRGCTCSWQQSTALGTGIKKGCFGIAGAESI